MPKLPEITDEDFHNHGRREPSHILVFNNGNIIRHYGYSLDQYQLLVDKAKGIAEDSEYITDYAVYTNPSLS